MDTLQSVILRCEGGAKNGRLACFSKFDQNSYDDSDEDNWKDTLEDSMLRAEKRTRGGGVGPMTLEGQLAC